MSANTLSEFLNENLHRNYPILDDMSARDVSATFNIPTELIADIRLVCVDGFQSSGKFYISGIVIRGYTADVEIGYLPPTGVAVTVGVFHDIDIRASEFREYELAAFEQTDSNLIPLQDTYGILVAGVGAPAASLPGAWVFDSSASELCPACVTAQTTRFRSLRVGDRIITGDVVLEEGDGVTLEVEEDPTSAVTTIRISASRPQAAGVVIDDDASLLSALTQLYGEPVTTINQIPPVNGNFDIKAADCLALSQTLSGITLSNPCGVPCCDKDSYLTPVYESVNQLNSRHVRLEDFLKEVRGQLNTLLGRLKDLENSVGAGGF